MLHPITSQLFGLRVQEHHVWTIEQNVTLAFLRVLGR
jgi:hypothetical protein